MTIRGLVLAGGGGRGAYQVGVIKCLAELRQGYRVITGTSVGAINAVGLAHWPPHRFHFAAAWIERLWLDRVSSKSIWTKRFGGMLSGLFKPSFGKTDPLRELLIEVLSKHSIRRSGIKLRMPAVDLITGRKKVYTEKDDPVTAVMASASFPGAFPPVWDDGMYLTDGGVVDIAPVGAAIAAGADDIVVILTSDPPFSPIAVPKTALKVAQRAIDLMGDEIVRTDLARVGHINALVRAGLLPGKKIVRCQIIRPSETLGDSLDFSKELTRSRMDLGYKDAQALLFR